MQLTERELKLAGIRLNETPLGIWYIMNARAWIPGRKTPETIFDTDGDYDSTMVVALKDGKTPVFILGSGKSNYYGKPGETERYIIDTGNGLRNPPYDSPGIKIQNLIVRSKGGDIDEGNGIGMNEKRPLWVFK